MSPCTKKLSDLKGKRFKKYVQVSVPMRISYRHHPERYPNDDGSYSAGKPQSLFAKLGKKSYEQSTSAEQGRTAD